ncbi:sphinganine kinase lcb4 [Savitreella phatthalungensis]
MSIPEYALSRRSEGDRRISRQTARAMLLSGSEEPLRLVIEATGLRILNARDYLNHPEVHLHAVMATCCGSARPRDAALLIPLHDIVGCSYDRVLLTVRFIRRDNGKTRLDRLDFGGIIDDQRTQELVRGLWAAAYGPVKPRKLFKVLLNPFGGTGKAKTIFHQIVAPMLEAAECVVHIEETRYRFHARDIAEQIDVGRYDAIICVSGDGLPHEVFNGLGRRKDARYALANLPIGFIPAGSGNGAARSIYNTHDPVECTLSLLKGIETPIDIMSVTQPGQPRLLAYFSISYGVIADCDVGTDNLRWMGPVRFDVRVIQRVLQARAYPCTLSVVGRLQGDKAAMRAEFDTHVGTPRAQVAELPIARVADVISEEGLPPLKYGSVEDALDSRWVTREERKMGTLWAGLMPYMAAKPCVFPAARPNTGAIDVMWMRSDNGLVAGLSAFSAVDKAAHYDAELCNYGKWHAFRVVPHKKRENWAIDGEPIPHGPVQVEVHKGLGRIITVDGLYFSEWRKGNLT